MLTTVFPALAHPDLQMRRHLPPPPAPETGEVSGGRNRLRQAQARRQKKFREHKATLAEPAQEIRKTTENVSGENSRTKTKGEQCFSKRFRRKHRKFRLTQTKFRKIRARKNKFGPRTKPTTIFELACPDPRPCPAAARSDYPTPPCFVLGGA